MLHVALISILLVGYGLHQIEGYTDPELTIHHDGVSMKLICSASPGATGYTWKLNSNTILQDNCTGIHSEFMSANCYPNGTGILIIKDGWTHNSLGTCRCIVYYPNATHQAVRNISAHDVVLLKQTNYDNITLTCSYTMPYSIHWFRWTMGETVIGSYWSESCSPVGTDPLPGYSVKCEGKKNMTLVVQPEAIQDSMQKWTCGVVTYGTKDYIDSIPLQLNVSPRVAPFIRLENIIRVRQDETAVLRIDVLSNPSPVFFWSKLTDTDQWTPVGRFKRMTVVSESLQSVLTIPVVGPEDVGRYKMVASNGYGRSFVQEYEVFVEGHTIQGSSNNTVILICGIAGACLVLIAVGVGIKCYRSKQRPRPGAQSLNMADGRSAELHYYSTVDESEPQTSRDNGNNDGTSSPVERENVNKKASHAANPNRINVNVDLSAKVRPRADPLIKLENIIRVNVSETAVLRIDVLSNPPPVFSWYKLTDTDEWTPVELFKHIVVLNERLHSNMIIPGAGPHNEGTYRVVASNGYGIPFIQEYEVILEDGAPAAEEGTHVHERANQAAKQIRAFANVNQSVPDGASSTEVGALEYEQTTRVNKAEHVYTDLQETGEYGRSSSAKRSNVNKRANPAAANKGRPYVNVTRSVPGGASSTGVGVNRYEQTARGYMDEHVYTDIR